jgi:hypothetical protein
VGAVAEGRFLRAFAGTEPVVVLFWGGEFQGFEISAFVGTIAERLGLTSSTTAPVDGFVLFQSDDSRPGAGDQWYAQGLLLLNLLLKITTIG